MSGGATSRAYVLLVGLFLYLPLVVLAVFSFNASPLMAFPLTGFTLDWYGRVLGHASMLHGLLTSFLIAQPVGMLATLGGLCAALTLTAPGLRLRAGFALCVAIPFLVPKGVLAIAQVIVLTRIGIPRGAPALIAAETLAFLPFATAIIAAVLVRLDRRLEDAARDLGATPGQSFRRVLLPQLRGGLLAAYSAAVILSLSDLSLSMYLAGRTQPLSLVVASAFRRELSPELNAMQVLLLALTAIAAAAAALLQSRRRRRRTASAG